MTYKLTVRRGPHVTREKFEDLTEAVAAMEHRAKDIRSEGPLQPKKLFRDYNPGVQVAGRVEISTGGFLRSGESAGVDVMGDGSLVAFKGGVQREELDPGQNGPFAAIREALS